ncbi:MAG: ROK family protein [bacterium]
MNEDIRVGTSFYIRDLNKASIFSLIHKYGPISRKELAANTDYSKATITNHVNRLLENDYLIETDKGHSTGGRKPVYLVVNPDKAYIFVLSIEVKNIELVLFDLDFEIVARRNFDIKFKPEEIMNEINNEIVNILLKQGISENRIIGIGVSVPGIVNRNDQSLVFAPNLGWKDIKIADIIKAKFKFPIIIENEANAAALGEKEFGDYESDNLIYVSINEGVGCGIIIDDRLYRGSSGNAGEFGHIIIDNDGLNCHCGKNGCWETNSSENFIINTVNDSLNKSLKINEIYQEAQNENEEIIKILNQTGENIGLGLVNIINSLSPKKLIIGGNITKVKDFISDDIMKVVTEKTLSASLDKTDIEFSKEVNNPIIYGMAQLIFNKYFNIYKCI